jgi:DNA invertase Pin-like site-specific DNA recombinase
VAGCLAYAYAVYTDPLHRATREDTKEAIRQLGSYGILSVRTIALIVKASIYMVREQPIRRGTADINPDHLQFLLYLLSGKGSDKWLSVMVEGGTNIATIAHLLGVSRSTIYRRMENH